MQRRGIACDLFLRATVHSMTVHTSFSFLAVGKYIFDYTESERYLEHPLSPGSAVIFPIFPGDEMEFVCGRSFGTNIDGDSLHRNSVKAPGKFASLV